MGPEAWRRQIGEDAFNHICAHEENNTAATSYAHDIERGVADTLTRAVEAGFRAPGVAPTIDPKGTKVLWPGGDENDRPVLTAAGLLRLYTLRGHGFLIMRVPQLLRAVAGDLLPRLQEVMAAYEDQCRAEGVEPLPVDWRVFVGGKEEAAHPAVTANTLYEESPKPDTSHRQTKTIAGPGANR